MLYNLDWLIEGEKFPPTPEITRISKYQKNRLLFKNQKYAVFGEYNKRVNNISSEFRHYENLTKFGTDLAYHQLLAIKKADLSVEESPDINIGKNYEEQKEEMLDDSLVLERLPEVVYDIVALGDALIRIHTNTVTGKCNAFAVAPEMWFPIVDIENIKIIKQHVLCWIVEVTPETDRHNPKYELHGQIIQGNVYQNFSFKIKSTEMTDYINENTKENIRVKRYVLGKLISIDKQWKDSGFKQCPLIDFHNITSSDSLYGIDDYERIHSIVAELETRFTLGSMVLDKYSSPTMYGSQDNLEKLPDGTYAMQSGNFVIVGKEEQPPGMIVWNGDLIGNFTQIDKLLKQLYIMTELGMVIDDESYGGTQGYEALLIKFTNALLANRRLQNRMTRPLKKVISVISELYAKPVKAKDVQINWKDGIPNNEINEINKAVLEKQNGLNSLERILMKRYGMNEQEAREEIDRIQQNQVDSAFVNRFPDKEDDDQE